MPRVTVSARRSTKTPLGQRLDGGPGGFRRFLVALGISVVLAGLFLWWAFSR